jgi:hypothetical protein
VYNIRGRTETEYRVQRGICGANVRKKWEACENFVMRDFTYLIRTNKMRYFSLII